MRRRSRTVAWLVLAGLLVCLAVALPLAMADRGIHVRGPLPTPRVSLGHRAPPPAAPVIPGVLPTIAAPPPPQISDEKLLGQRIMVGLDGTSASPALLGAVRRGQVGAVILFAANIVGGAQVTALTTSLQRAARAGHNPPLLVAIDQEGGQVRRFPDGPPSLSPPEMASNGSAGVAFHQGALTGGYLKPRGINWDLAPVLDVPTFSGAFISQQGRAFSPDPRAVATYAGAFARGVQAAGIAATGKHFPGVGSAPVDTDNKLDELHPSAAQRRGALIPYHALISRGLDAVMLSTAGFPAYDASGRPAALSPPMIQGVLRQQLGFRGVTITDSLDSPTGHDEVTAGVLAAAAGADVLLFVDSAPGELHSLLTALHGGLIKRADAEASYQRILALKRRVAH